MKKIALMLLVALLSSTAVMAQKTVIKKNQSKEPVFDVVEVMPQFPGGQDSLMSFLMHTVKYPKEAMEKGVQGRVVVQFIVEKDGTVSSPNVVKAVTPALDQEAIRVVQCMPKWAPGKQRGKEVRTKFTLPVTFRLH